VGGIEVRRIVPEAMGNSHTGTLVPQHGSGTNAGLSHLNGGEGGEESGEEGVVPSGALELALHRPLGRFELGEIEGGSARQGDIFRAMILAVSW
jgi:hypothetical protein